MANKREYYETYGDVRGSCDHNHRTIEAAERCLEKDSRGCKKQGGYSDRSIYRVIGDDRQFVRG